MTATLGVSSISTTAFAAKPKPKPAATAKGPSLKEAKAHYESGLKKFNGGDFAGALDDFKAADAIKSTPQSQRYIGLCEDKLGHYAEAVAAYERFLAAVPAKMKKEGEELTKRVAEIKAMPAKLHVETTPPGATITADGKQMAVTPADIELTPGKHILRLELAGYLPIDKDVDVAYGAKEDVKNELQAKPAEATPPAPVATTPPPTTPAPAEPPPAEEPQHRSKVPAFITGGIAVAALGVGIGFGIAALGKKSDFDSNPQEGTAEDGENFALVADMAFGVAITLGVTSAVLFFTKDDEPAKAANTHTPRKVAPLRIIPTPFITPHGGGAGAVMRF